jgi:putative ABC transport system permease protein
VIVPLARKSLLHEWRRFLPAVLAVAFSGLLLLVQAALVLGIFGSAAVYVDASDGDLWVGNPGTQSVELGRPIPLDTELWLRMDPEVERVEPFRWVDGDWRAPGGRGAVSISVSGIATTPEALMFARVLSPQLRVRLEEPDAVVVDEADLDKLGVAVGGQARINGQTVRVVGATAGLRSLAGVNVLASLETAQRLQGSADERVAYYLVRLRPAADAAAVQARLAAAGPQRGFEVWTRDDFSRQASSYWLFETGAGLGVLFLALVVCAAGAVITSQTLMAAVAGSTAEYATLQALGVGVRALRAVVLEQAAWVGSFGLLLALLGTAGAIVLARAHAVPVALGPAAASACAALVMGIALVSGWSAVRTLRHADPATLLR